jgi:hypothetical protein
MDSEGLLPCSQEFSTAPHNDPDINSPYKPIIFLEDQF